MFTIDKVFELAAKPVDKKSVHFIIQIAGDWFETVTLPTKELQAHSWKYPIGTILFSFETYDRILQDGEFKIAEPPKHAPVSSLIFGITINQASLPDCKKFYQELKEAIASQKK